MPVFCVVYGCSNRSCGENTRSFYRVRKCVVHKEGKVACKPASAVGRSRSDNTRVQMVKIRYNNNNNIILIKSHK